MRGEAQTVREYLHGEHAYELGQHYLVTWRPHEPFIAGYDRTKLYPYL